MRGFLASLSPLPLTLLLLDVDASSIDRFFSDEILERVPRRSKTEGGLLLPLLDRPSCESLCADRFFEPLERFSRRSAECSECSDGSSSVFPSL